MHNEKQTLTIAKVAFLKSGFWFKPFVDVVLRWMYDRILCYVKTDLKLACPEMFIIWSVLEFGVMLWLIILKLQSWMRWHVLKQWDYERCMSDGCRSRGVSHHSSCCSNWCSLCTWCVCLVLFGCSKPVMSAWADTEWFQWWKDTLVSLRELVTMFEYSECDVHLFTSVAIRSGNILFLFPHVHCSKNQL